MPRTGQTCDPAQQLIEPSRSLSAAKKLSQKSLSVVAQTEAVISPQTRILMARFDPLRAVAIDVVFRPLDRPDHIGLLHASGLQAHILCHFLDIVKIHMAPPKSWVCGNSTPDLAPLKIFLKKFVSGAGHLQSKCLPRLSS